jgi:hypothetical protein
MDINDSIVYAIGEENLVVLRENYENSKLKEYLLDVFSREKAPETNDRIIRKYAPVYMEPSLRNGRAHFYAPYKQVGSLSADTFWFNLAVLWIAIILLYIALYYNVLYRMLSFFGNLKSLRSQGANGTAGKSFG